MESRNIGFLLHTHTRNREDKTLKFHFVKCFCIIFFKQ